MASKKGALPILLLGGAALLLMGGKKGGGPRAGGDIYEENPDVLNEIDPNLRPAQGATKKASFDPRILTHQMNLTLLGYYKGPIDGVNGSGTKAAVKKFQSDVGLTPDGIIGPKTEEMLIKAIQLKGLAAQASATLEKYKQGLGL